jgi:hypothetical protein
MMRHVPNSELRLENIPAPEAGWEAHADFAHSFFGHEDGHLPRRPRVRKRQDYLIRGPLSRYASPIADGLTVQRCQGNG